MKEGNVLKSVAAAQQVVTAVLENFEFDLTYTVTGFTVSVNDKGFEITAESNNNRLTDKQKSLISNLRAGQKLIIEKIKAVGPDGRTRDLTRSFLRLTNNRDTNHEEDNSGRPRRPPDLYRRNGPVVRRHLHKADAR
jgi:hypothetical protein